MSWLRWSVDRLPHRWRSELRYWNAARQASTSRTAAVARPPRLAISLTSYPPRFATLDLTLRSLRRQTLSADTILLWIAHADLPQLPRRVRAMAGVEIIGCDDVRSYKKLVFALQREPLAYIATADDDVFYPPDWLETLLAGSRAYQEPVIACHRAHRLCFDDAGAALPYEYWDKDVQDCASREPSTDLVPIGIGGILYPPYALPPLTTERASYLALAPTADDLWFYFMARIAGARHRKVGGRFQQISWPASQRERLFDHNATGGNDRQFAALEAAFRFSETNA